MNVRASIVVMSHLSDAQELLSRSSGLEIKKHINFAKYVIFHCGGNLNQEINPDKLWSEFIQQPVEKMYS